jgi:hypothetical protein
MPNRNEKKRVENEDGKVVGSGVGAVPGDTISSALDPFGSAAGPIKVENQDSDNQRQKNGDDS